MSNAIPEFLRLVEGEFGLHFDPRHSPGLEARVPDVARELGYPSVAALLAALRGSGGLELRRRAAALLTIGETYFFRHPAQFDHIANTVLPALAQACRETARPLRIWMPGCATGEEACSMAILLVEQGLHTALEIQLLATDINETALSVAAAGRFGRRSVERATTPERIDRFFTADGDEYVLDPEAHRLVTFRYGNLLADDAGPGTFDSVICRNMLIYFGADQAERAGARLAAAIRRGGYLVLGHADPFDRRRHGMEPSGPPGLFTYQRVGDRVAAPGRSRRRQASVRPAAPKKRDPPAPEPPAPEPPSAVRLLLRAQQLESDGDTAGALAAYRQGLRGLEGLAPHEVLADFDGFSAGMLREAALRAIARLESLIARHDDA